MKKLAIAFAVLLSAPAYAAKPMSCESLTGLRLPDTTITTATVVPAAMFNPAIVTTACRVAGSIKPTSDSDIRFEVWMPTEGWNGKFLSAGEGGYAGSISYGGIGGALRRGYAGGSRPKMRVALPATIRFRCSAAMWPIVSLMTLRL